jgi:Icc-related predicted phosphoesterase
MRILAVSDRIEERLYTSSISERYKKVDLLIGCGDLPFFYLDYLMSTINKPLIYVRGNHDTGPQFTADGRELNKVPGGIDIHGRIIEMNDLLIAGLEGSMRYRPGAPYMYSETEMTWNIARLVPKLLWNLARYGRALDILVAHSPPYEIHDGKDLAHRGFKIFRTFIERFRPRYFLHGHIHVYRNDVPRVTKYLETTVINVYPARIFKFE